MSEYHIPVLLEESLEGLKINPAGIYIDVTFGGGGHSRAIINKLTTGRLIAFDQDEDAKANSIASPNFTFVHHNFRYMRYFLRYLNIAKVDGILADLGVSSHHFDESNRGFSFRFDSELDMRMNRNKTRKASDIVNEYSQENLASIFRNYGEVEKPWQIAEAIVKHRQVAKIRTTGDLLTAIGEIIPERFRNKSLARVYQALRIEVNGEMEALKEFLEQAADVLNPRGRLVVITYHSLEDRLVKNFLKFGNFEGKPEKDFFGNIIAPLEPVNRKIVTPNEAEIERNPRSRSAKLRIAQRTVYEPTRATNPGI